MTPQELKSSILQLAVQGRLVEQRPEEGTAEELYRQIQEEKQRLIKEGKIKKEKPLPEITEDEVPFDIPESWKWVRLGNIITRNPKNSLDDSLDVSFIPMNCVSDGYRNKHTFETRKWGEIKKGFTHFADGDIAVAKITPCFQNRKSVIFRHLINGVGAGTTELSVVRTINNTVYDEFLLWFFKSDYFILNGVKSFSGTAGQQRIDKNYMTSCLFPLPPLAEQKRIVAKIEELLPYIDRYEKAWSKLEDFNKRFPGDMQKSVLQMAIQGKLVEQRSEEGTGEELYRQIQAQKQSLIKSGKIKKEKPLPEITEDEIPFDIPESWKWVRLKNIVSVLSDGIHGTPIYDESGKYYFINGNNLMKGRIIIKNDTKKVSESEYQKHKKPLDENSILVSINGTIGNYAFYDGEPVILGKSACYLSVMNGIHKQFVCYLINTDFFLKYASNEATQTTIKNVSLKSMRMFPVPLPPLVEQKRIVQKLEQILPLCERLK